MHLAVLHNATTWDQLTGEIQYQRYILTEDGKRKGDIPRYVREAEPTVFITVDPSSFLAQLQETYALDPEWRYTLTRSQQEIQGMGMSRVKIRTFGFRTGHPRLHQCWDPRAMSPTPMHKFIDGEVTHESLLSWATDVRAWAQANDLDLRNAFAGYAAQLLRDKRFYPEPRRKVPRITNEKARPSLPGNLVNIYVPPGPRAYNVTSIDQRSAHHRIVQSLPLPDANTLWARGEFGDPENVTDFWAERNTPAYLRTVSQPGLVYVGMHSRRTLKREYRLPVQDYHGYQRTFLYTNMIPFVERNGSHIDGIYAAWTSSTVDDGLPRYGAWAQAEIESAPPRRKQWLKPLLHSTYGLLAARPRPLEIGHSQARGGKHEHFLLGPRQFDVRMTQLPNWQPVIANVIQRGMIEAETQIRSLTMAQELTAAGCDVLHIHTDGLHVQGQLPLLPDDWAINGLTRVTYIDRVSWIAQERTCLPGREGKERLELIEHYHTMTGAYREVGRVRSTVSRFREGRRSHRTTQRTTQRTNVQESRTDTTDR